MDACLMCVQWASCFQGIQIKSILYPGAIQLQDQQELPQSHHYWQCKAYQSSTLDKRKGPYHSSLPEVDPGGFSAHAAAAPWEGVNALDAAFLAYSNISVLRQQIKPTHRVHGIVEGKNWSPGGSYCLILTRTLF